jgi:hypothetical protein
MGIGTLTMGLREDSGRHNTGQVLGDSQRSSGSCAQELGVHSEATEHFGVILRLYNVLHILLSFEDIGVVRGDRNWFTDLTFCY